MSGIWETLAVMELRLEKAKAGKSGCRSCGCLQSSLKHEGFCADCYCDKLEAFADANERAALENQVDADD